MWGRLLGDEERADAQKSTIERMMMEMTSSHTEAASFAAPTPGLGVQLFLGLMQFVFFNSFPFS